MLESVRNKDYNKSIWLLILQHQHVKEINGMPWEKNRLIEKEVLMDILDRTDINVYVVDAEKKQLVYMNETMRRTFGLGAEEGKPCWKVLQKGLKGPCEFCRIDQLMNDNAGDVCVWTSRSPVTGRIYKNHDRLMEYDGRKYFVENSVDVTELVQLTEKSSIDELTKMLNRRAGKEKLAEAIECGRRENRCMAVALCDVNELKQVNDLYGHSEGDRLLRYLAAVMSENLTGDDFGFRLSGDEFVLVFCDEDSRGAGEKLKRIQAQLMSSRAASHIFYEVSFSYGLVEIHPEEDCGVKEVISRADERMYVQKRAYHIRKASEGLLGGDAAADRDKRFEYDEDHLFEALAASTDDYAFSGDLKTGTFRYPSAMVREFGLPGEVVENAAAYWAKLIHPDDRQHFLESNQEIADGRAVCHDIEYRARNLREEWIWLRCRGRMFCDEGGAPWLFAGTIENQGKNSKTDHMTGLSNKYEFEDRIKKFLVSSKGADKLGMIILDLDSFKNINDLYNRSFGDEIIRITANRIAMLLPPEATLYRLDGDEFGILADGGDVESCRSIYSRIQKNFHKQQEHNGRKYYCTLSAGCVCCPDDADDFQTLLKYANYSLEYSKMMGKNRLTVFSPAILKKQERKLELNELLRESIERGFIGFTVCYQPQISPLTKEIYGAEALARWRCHKYGEVSPVEFIPLLEQSGLIVQLGRWIFYQAARQCKEWKRYKDNFHMSINLSYRQLMDDSILGFMKRSLKEIGLTPHHITMELTETYLLQEDVAIQHVIKEMQSMGVHIAMDDFGTGYSSLVSLKKIPVNLVKIDRGFAKNIDTDLFNATFIRSITELCHDVGKMVCLEGVESEAEYQAVADKGIELIQGFYFGKPMPAERFEAFMKNYMMEQAEKERAESEQAEHEPAEDGHGN